MDYLSQHALHSQLVSGAVRGAEAPLVLKQTHHTNGVFWTF